MIDPTRLWATAILLGAWVGIARLMPQLTRYPRWSDRIGAVMLSLTATLLTLLFYWETLSPRPSLLLLAGGAAGWFGPELPTIMKSILRTWLGSVPNGKDNNGDANGTH